MGNHGYRCGDPVCCRYQGLQRGKCQLKAVYVDISRQGYAGLHVDVEEIWPHLEGVGVEGFTREGVLEHVRKGLRARGVVGVIAAPGCQLEILPKIEGLGEHDATDDALRRRLIHMLAVVHDLRIDTGSMTQLSWQKDTVLELLIRLFCTRLLEAVRMGFSPSVSRKKRGLLSGVIPKAENALPASLTVLPSEDDVVGAPSSQRTRWRMEEGE